MKQKKILRKKLKRLENNMSIVRRLSVAFLVVFFFVGSGSALAQISELVEPLIVISPDTYYPLEEILYIEGHAESGSTVRVIFSKDGEVPVRFVVKADSAGQWFLQEKVHLVSGIWEVRVRAEIDNPGDIVSEWSNPRLIRSVITAMSFGGIQIKYITITLIVFSILAIVCGTFIYFVIRVRRIKKVLLRKQVKDAGVAISHGFAEIRQDLIEELRAFEKEIDGKGMTAEQLARKERIFREIENIEKNIEKEVEDIEDKL